MNDPIEQRPRVLRKAAAVLGGIAAVLVAAVTVKDALFKLVLTSAPAHTSQPVQQLVNATEESPVETKSKGDEETTEPTPAPFPTEYRTDNGTLAQLAGGDWKESNYDGATFNFTVKEREEDMTVLFDASRNVYIRFPTRGGRAEIRFWDQAAWFNLYHIEPTSG